jgi:hypothetical protein
MFAEQEKREDMRVVFQEYGGTWQANERDRTRAGVFWPGSAYLTRLHFRYDAERFPEDLTLQITTDTTPYQVNYTAIRPAENACRHPAPMQARQREMQLLANLTGWPMDQVMGRVQGRTQGRAPPETDVPPTPGPREPKWYEKLWK